MTFDEKVAFLESLLRRYSPSVIAFSGGVDSALLAAEALRAVGKDAVLGMTAVSATATRESIQNARSVAAQMGLTLLEFSSEELNDSHFLANGARRCYYCKALRFAKIRQLAGAVPPPSGEWHFLEGSNADDRFDYRPGKDAALENGFLAPLAEAEMTKADIRRLATLRHLSCAQRPSEPCLVTRLAYGIRPTPDLLRQIEEGEKILHQAGFAICRLRLLTEGNVRVEVAPEQLPRLGDCELANRLTSRILSLGFTRVEFDPQGYVSGKMNRALKSL